MTRLKMVFVLKVENNERRWIVSLFLICLLRDLSSFWIHSSRWPLLKTKKTRYIQYLPITSNDLIMNILRIRSWGKTYRFEGR